MKTRPLTIFIVFALFVISCASGECTREGVQCKDCFTLANCVKDADNATFHYEDEVKCPDGIPCDEINLYCSRFGACRTRRFICPPNEYEEEMIFPDPYSCNAYHGCFGDAQNDYRCLDGTAFDPFQKNCSLPIDDPSCNEYPVLCEQEGDTFVKGTDYLFECIALSGTVNVIYPEVRMIELTNSLDEIRPQNVKPAA